MDVPLLFSVAASLILVGFLSNVFFDRIKIPESVILILLGILLGPVFHVFDPEGFLSFSGIMASIAIMVIMFEAGLNLDLRRVLREAPKSLLFALSFYSLSVVLISFAVLLLTGWDYLYCLLVGALLGGTSAAVVIPLIEKMNIDKEERLILELESTVTNVINVVLALAIAQVILLGTVDVREVLSDIVAAFAASIFIGALAGYGWQFVLKKLQAHPLTYMLTLAALLYLYAAMDLLGFSGPLAALTFGAVLANVHIVSPLRTVHLIQLHREISFFIRVFFFVFLGVIFRTGGSPIPWIIAGSIATISILTRYLAAHLLGIRNKILFAALIPRGLSEAVIASLLLQYGLPHVMEILQITSITIVLTNVLTAIYVIILQRQAPAIAEAQGA